MKHRFHKIIGGIFNDMGLAKNKFKIVMDKSCGGEHNHKNSLYNAPHRSNGNRFSDVDILILAEGKVKVIIEIEESNVKPIHLFGKFLAGAMSSYYIHSTRDDSPAEFADGVLFLQLLNSSGLSGEINTKYKQWENIKQAIQAVIASGGTKVGRYELIYGVEREFDDKGKKKADLISAVKEALR